MDNPILPADVHQSTKSSETDIFKKTIWLNECRHNLVAAAHQFFIGFYQTLLMVTFFYLLIYYFLVPGHCFAMLVWIILFSTITLP